MSDQKIITELKVSGHLMRLETGIYCVFHANGHHPHSANGLPGVRISLPPGSQDLNGAVEVSGFRNDGWVSTGNDAALIRVSEGPAQVLVTVYQSAAGGEALPQLQVVRLGDFHPNGMPSNGEGVGAAAAIARPAAMPAAVASAPVAATPDDLGVTAHVQRRGDIVGALGEWVGERGSKLWIEGFSMLPPPAMRPEDLEYQAVLGRGWLSPWSQGGQFCGSRRMALPVLGLRIRLRGAAAAAFECAYSATFTDGSMVGPVAAGEACESESLAPLESFQAILRPRGAAAHPAPVASREPPEVAVAARSPAARSGRPAVAAASNRSERSLGKALPRRR